MASDLDVLSDIWLEIEEELSGEVAMPVPPDRRGRARTRCMADCVGLMSELQGDELPPEAAYLPVLLRDFSGNGVAFHAPREMAIGQSVVLRLGIGGVERAIEAQVVRCVRTNDGGRVSYVVGCRWTQILA